VEVILGSRPFTVTERDWFQIQLRVLYLELRGPKFVTTLQFRDEKNPDSFLGLQLTDEIQVVCYISCSTTRELGQKKECREKQLEFYTGWVKSTKAKIEETAQRFPALRREFSVEKNTAFLILDDYGMGSTEVCLFIGDSVIWFTDRTGNKAR
jgi:hypothetical protein